MTATLAGNRVIEAAVNIPAWGAWWAEVTLDEEHTLSGKVTLQLADLSLVGFVVSGGPTQGRSYFRLVGGAGGWSKELPPKAYSNDAGVRLATVVQDAALEAGETLDASSIPDTRVGPSFVRERGPAGRVLQLLSPEAWYVGEDGITRLGRRASSTLTSQATLGELDTARGTVTLAAEEIAQILPGVRVGELEVVDVYHELSSANLRSTVWGKGLSDTSRRLSAMRRTFEQLFPQLQYLGDFEFRVVTLEGERVNLQPVRVTLGLPELRRVPIRPGIAGAKTHPALGSRVLVRFVNSDPARPVVVGFEDADSSGFASTSTTIKTDDLTLSAGSTGAQAWEHATSIEAVVSLLVQVVLQIEINSPGPLTGAGLAAQFITSILPAAIPLVATTPLDPASAAAIIAALAAKVADPTHLIPGVGWPKVKGA